MGNSSTERGQHFGELYAPNLAHFTSHNDPQALQIEYPLTWTHKSSNQSLIEYLHHAHSDQQLIHFQENFTKRKKHAQLTSTLFFKCIPIQLASTTAYDIRIFYQRIIGTLASFKEIPFQDVPYFYYQSLKGFRQLCQHFGCFEVDEKMFQINEEAQLKLWISDQVQEKEVRSKRITQAEMVQQVINIVDANIDKKQEKVSFKEKMKACRTFQDAIYSLQQCCRTCDVQVFNRLTCLGQFKKPEIWSIFEDANYRHTSAQLNRVTLGFQGQAGRMAAGNIINEISQSRFHQFGSRVCSKSLKSRKFIEIATNSDSQALSSQKNKMSAVIQTTAKAKQPIQIHQKISRSKLGRAGCSKPVNDPHFQINSQSRSLASGASNSACFLGLSKPNTTTNLVRPPTTKYGVLPQQVWPKRQIITCDLHNSENHSVKPTIKYDGLTIQKSPPSQKQPQPLLDYPLTLLKDAQTENTININYSLLSAYPIPVQLVGRLVDNSKLDGQNKLKRVPFNKISQNAGAAYPFAKPIIVSEDRQEFYETYDGDIPKIYRVKINSQIPREEKETDSLSFSRTGQDVLNLFNDFKKNTQETETLVYDPESVQTIKQPSNPHLFTNPQLYEYLTNRNNKVKIVKQVRQSPNFIEFQQVQSRYGTAETIQPDQNYGSVGFQRTNIIGNTDEANIETPELKYRYSFSRYSSEQDPKTRKNAENQPAPAPAPKPQTRTLAKNRISIEQQQAEGSYFPSITDISQNKSDNISFLPLNKASSNNRSDIVQKYAFCDPVFQGAQRKYYQPIVDQRIMADLRKLRNY